jgi:hypothetical protein
MTHGIDRTNFSDLESCDPHEVVSRTGCEFDETLNQYRLKVWGREYRVDLNQSEVRPEGSTVNTFHEYLYLFILYFLMKSKNMAPSGVWVSERDIPGGAAFFRGPHVIPVDGITNRFGDDLALFKGACENLKGIAIDMADAAAVFPITPTIPVAVLYWQGDEDFPSEAKLLFDRTIAQHLPLDIIWALAVEVCRRLGE